MHTSAMPEGVLAVEDLRAGYGKYQILRGVSFEVLRGEVVALLGGNGVGKTTLINAISGFLKPSGGRVLLEGMDVTGRPPHDIFKRGIVQVSQARDLFLDMSVEDNLRLGYAMRETGLGVGQELERVFASFPRLSERRRQMARTLSGGEQQMLSIGRAVMSRPKVLMLDEPSGGLAPQLVNEIGIIASSLKAGGTTMLLVEQNIGLALKIADRFIILRDGVIAGGDAIASIRTRYDEIIRSIYL
jgi:branched-chain amino acid transport system ATP-binding protein